MMRFLLYFVLMTTALILSSSKETEPPVVTPKEVLEEAKLIKTDPNGFEFTISNQIVLSFAFGKSHVKNEADIDLVRNVKVKRVSLIYSWMPHATDTDHDVRQEDLNLKRLEDLQTQLPELFKTKDIEWEFVVQTNFSYPNQAKELFHGFIIHY